MAALDDQRLAHDILATLVSDRGFLCVELRDTEKAGVLAAIPPHLGCSEHTDAELLEIPVGQPGRASLLVRFDDTQAVQAKRRQETFTHLIVGLSFLFSVLTAAIGFRVIVTGPLQQLLTSIRSSTETGIRLPLNSKRNDELGVVIRAFDEMQAREAGRERVLQQANADLVESREDLAKLNEELEERIDLRTSELRRREAELHLSEQRFKSFAEASSDWFWEMDQNCRFTYFSDRFTETTGVPQKALLGKTREETGVPNVDPEEWEKHLADLAARRSFREFRHPRTLPDGRIVHLSINGKAVFDEKGTFLGYRGTGSDITARTEIEAARAESEERFPWSFRSWPSRDGYTVA